MKPLSGPRSGGAIRVSSNPNTGQLPPWLEDDRNSLATRLPAFEVAPSTAADQTEVN